MSKYPKTCFLCKNSIPDPEYGYACGVDMWDYFGGKSDSCPKYSLNRKAAVKEGIEFFESGYYAGIMKRESTGGESNSEKITYGLLAAELFKIAIKIYENQIQEM